MKIIAFCGIDGAGKTTQIMNVKHDMEQKGYKVYVSKVNYFPFYLYQDELITQMEVRIQMAFCFAQHYLELIPKLKHQKYDFILCDRHRLCHLAFAKTYGIQDITKIEKIFSIAGEPDFTFYLDIPVDTALKRIFTRNSKKIDTDETKEILLSTYRNYAEALTFPQYQNVITIDATLTEEEQGKNMINKIFNYEVEQINKIRNE